MTAAKTVDKNALLVDAYAPVDAVALNHFGPGVLVLRCAPTRPGQTADSVKDSTGKNGSQGRSASCVRQLDDDLHQVVSEAPVAPRAANSYQFQEPADPKQTSEQQYTQR